MCQFNLYFMVKISLLCSVCRVGILGSVLIRLELDLDEVYTFILEEKDAMKFKSY